MRKNWLLLISMLILGLTVQSPAQPENPEEMGADMAARREKMEALRIYKMTEFLELTSEHHETTATRGLAQFEFEPGANTTVYK